MNSTNPFIYSDDNKRYHTLNYYNKSSFNSKVFKAVIDAGFTCPNKDGTKGTGGCIYCMGGSGYFTEKSDGEIYDSVKRPEQPHYSLLSGEYQNIRTCRNA